VLISGVFGDVIKCTSDSLIYQRSTSLPSTRPISNSGEKPPKACGELSEFKISLTLSFWKIYRQYISLEH
jgi:hypothetical protein